MSSRIEYNKKPGKPAVIKVVKDNTVQRDDLYKSGTIHTGQGEPPNSRSRPTPKAKQKPGKPISNGKLLRPGGPGGGPSKLASRPAASRPVPQQPPRPQPVATQSRPVPRPVHELNGVSHVRTESSSSINRAPPPPPPPPPTAVAKPKKDIYRVLYDFQGQSANEMRIQKDELLEILQKSDNGMSPSRLHSLSQTISRR
jgi:myosin-1